MHRGTLTLTYVARDSVAGTWDVPGYAPALLNGRLGGAAAAGRRYYALEAAGADGTGLGVVQHWVWGEGDALGCEGIHFYRERPSNAALVECSLLPASGPQ